MKKIERKKLSLSFVNKGDPFYPPNWTPKKHANALSKVAGMEGTDKEKDDEFKYYVILETLREIDETVTLDMVHKVHPMDLTDLFWEIYNAGREGIYYKEDFRKGQKKTPLNKK